MSRDLRHVGERVETLVQELGGLPDPRARAMAEEGLHLLMELYGGALARIMEIVDEQGVADKLFERFAGDGLVASLLVLHGLHPLDTETRIRHALERVRPYLGSHGGDVRFLGVEGGVARLRLEGSCEGCPSSAITMKLAIERAIEEAAPEVTRIDVEGVTQPPTPSKLLQIRPPRTESVAAAREADAGGWVALDAAPEMSAGQIATVDLMGSDLVLCRIEQNLYAYRSACPACGAALGDGVLDGAVLGCLGCGHRFDLRRAGRCVDAEALHLVPLPLLEERGRVHVAIAAGVA